MASRLSDRLLASGLVPLASVRAAVARQAVYGGALDTALLELDAIDEGTLWGELAGATELGIPDRTLCEAPQKLVKPDGSDALDLDAAWSARCRAVPVGLKDGTLQILCGEPVARAEIEAATRALAIPFALLVAPEIWIAAVQQAIYARPMEPRLVRLFARVVGAEPVRRWQAAHTPSHPGPARAPGRDLAAPDPAADFGDGRRPARASRHAGSPARCRPGSAVGGLVSGPVAVTVSAPHGKHDIPGLIDRLDEGDAVGAAHASAGGDHQAGLRSQTQALGCLVEAAPGRRADRLAVRGALPQDDRDPGVGRAGAARAHRRVLRLRVRSPPRRPRGRPRPLAILVDRPSKKTAGLARVLL